MTEQEYLKKLKRLRLYADEIHVDLRNSRKYSQLIVSPPQNLDNGEKSFVDSYNQLCFILNPINEEWLLNQKEREDYLRYAEEAISMIVSLKSTIDWN